jgi:5-methylcytosine-specific restriction protein A
MPAWHPRYTRLPQAVRQRVLRKHRICQVCRARPSTQVDHIIPVAEGGANTEANARGVCATCHAIKTAEERQRGLDRYRARQPRQRRANERHPGLIE